MLQAEHQVHSNRETGDWDAVVNNLKARLRLTPNDMPDCLVAVDELYATLLREFARRQQLEVDVRAAHTALAQTRSQLVSTQAVEKRTHHLAFHDSLTSLPNRRFLSRRLGHALSRAHAAQQSLAVFYIDLDGFKLINDTHGHGVGDALLKVVAVRLTHAMRAEDTVSRLGGDEFACLISGSAGRPQINRIATELLASVSAPMKIGRISLCVRPSIGIAMWPTDGTTGDALLCNADAAMYHAKRYRTGHAFFNECAIEGA